MERFFALGHAADVVIVWLLVEALLIWRHHRRTGRGVAPRTFAAAWGAGLLLAIALRLALTGAHWAWLAALLLGAGIAHLIDLRQRWRS